MSKGLNSSNNGLLMLLFASILWGTSFIVVKSNVSTFGYFFSLFFRLFFALIASIALFLLINRKTLRIQLFYFKQKSVYLLSFIGFISSFLQFFGATLTSSSNIALLINSSVIIVPIFSLFFLKEKLNNQLIFGISLGFSGLILITTGGNFQSILTGNFLGNFFCIIAGFFWAFYIILSKKILNNSKLPCTPLNLALSSIIISFIFLVPIIPYYLDVLSMVPIINLDIWFSLIYLGVLCTTIASVFYYFGLKTTTATNSSFILLTQIFIGVLLGIFILSEIPNYFHIFGMSLFMISILIMNVKFALKPNFLRKMLPRTKKLLS